jgi:hypothetical protein
MNLILPGLDTRPACVGSNHNGKMGQTIPDLTHCIPGRHDWTRTNDPLGVDSQTITYHSD